MALRFRSMPLQITTESLVSAISRYTGLVHILTCNVPILSGTEEYRNLMLEIGAGEFQYGGQVRTASSHRILLGEVFT